jgi:perosamine synthetase
MRQDLKLPRIPVSGPWITAHEVKYVSDAVRNAWYSEHRIYHDRFEKAFSDHLGVRYTMALPSCTSGLHLALAALGIGPGDEVIVPDVTWIASAAPITYVGATPVFADIDPLTWCLSPETVASVITARTRAIIAVELYGSMPDWDGLHALADRHGIPIIEDAAEAVGSRYRGRPAGSLGRISVFSFHGSKTLTTGEGGLLATNETELFRRAQVLRDHGRPAGDRYFQNTEIAYKYKMSSLQAALGLAQLERLDSLVERKREIFAWYRDILEPIKGIVLNAEPEGTVNSYWMTTALIDSAFKLNKRDVMDRLDAQGIDARPFFYPLSSLEAYAGAPQAELAQRRNLVSYELSPRGVNLPSGLNLTREDVDRVCGALVSILKG